MCGIAGAYNIQDYDVKDALKAISHRGRDQRKIVKFDKFVMGFNRLAIVGLNKSSQQPYEDDDIIVAFNGELYNYDKENYKSEMLWLVDLIKGSSQFYKFLDGQFFIVVYYKKEKKLQFVRDPWGIVPGYMNTDKSGITFGSEKKVVGHGYYEIPAGSSLTIDLVKGNDKLEYYFQPPINNLPFKYKIVGSMLGMAVDKIANHTDVGLSFALGGLDSTLLLQIALQKEAKINDIFTVGFGDDSDDIKHAEKVEEEFGVKVRKKILYEDEIITELDNLNYYLEDSTPNPVKFRGFLRNYFVAKNSKTSVILCGEGADELFYGYPYFKDYKGIHLAFKGVRSLESMPMINLDRVDRGGMAWTKEFRPIYLDKSFSTAVLQFARHSGKEELRELAHKRQIPGEFVHRPKYGSDEKYISELGIWTN